QENSRIFLPKLGWMRYRNSRQVTGVVKNVTVSQSCGKWYISIQTESEVSTPVHPSASMVGLDAGMAELATLSDGEDLKVSNMSKSAAGTVSQPGRNVRAKSGLNRSILNQGWYEMRRQLEYKQLWRGGQVLAVPPAYTSQRC
ncbi:RNA-guided endonuclease InsQ/TnpB family protein, partial [Escherichia coli]|uniref:RNA-guided endonuclease InsQ/TnpB family protein n=1 Tax=Escherichia coli TaxID=562 RepID=UPI000B9EF3D4